MTRQTAKPMAGKSKKARLEGLLSRPRGATMGQLQKALGWQPHTVRAAISRLRKKRRRCIARPKRQDAVVPHNPCDMSSHEIDDLPDQLREIAQMDHAACAAALSALPGITVPPRLRAETLRRLLAYETQLRALGGLTAQERRTLRAVANGKAGRDACVGVAGASPGAHLLREWNDRTYRVEVTEKGYVLDGTTYRSLSAVAKRITGTAWSGPRFFGLTGKRSA